MGKGRDILSNGFIAVAAFVCLAVTPAAAQSDRAVANGSVVIEEAIGTGVTYDLADQSLTRVFLNGNPSDLITIIRSSADKDGGLSGPLLLSAGSYRLGFLRGSDASGFRTDERFNNPLFLNASNASRTRSLLFLAQFN